MSGYHEDLTRFRTERVHGGCDHSQLQAVIARHARAVAVTKRGNQLLTNGIKRILFGKGALVTGKQLELFFANSANFDLPDPIQQSSRMKSIGGAGSTPSLSMVEVVEADQ